MKISAILGTLMAAGLVAGAPPAERMLRLQCLPLNQANNALQVLLRSLSNCHRRLQPAFPLLLLRSRRMTITNAVTLLPNPVTSGLLLRAPMSLLRRRRQTCLPLRMQKTITTSEEMLRLL